MKSILITSALLCLIAFTQTFAQHVHSYAGDFDDDGYLDFGDTLTHSVTTFLGTRSMIKKTSGIYFDDGYIFDGGWTPVALNKSDFPLDGITDDDGALSGSFIQIVLHAVSYAGAATNPIFAFYESGSTDPAFTMIAGTTNGTNGFDLTDQIYFDLVPSDPFGHHHGRRFAATAAGTYTIQWALVNIGIGTLNSTSNPDFNERFFTQTWNAVPEAPSWVILILSGASCILFAQRKKLRNLS